MAYAICSVRAICGIFPRMSLPAVGSTPLKPAELERFAALLAADRAPASAYAESGVGIAMACGLSELPDTSARVAYLRREGERELAQPVPNLRELARKYTGKAVRTLAA